MLYKQEPENSSTLPIKKLLQISANKGKENLQNIEVPTDTGDLNIEIALTLKAKHEILPIEKTGQWRLWSIVVLICIFFFVASIVIYLFWYEPTSLAVIESVSVYFGKLKWQPFLLMMLIGFLAQMADGSLGMGYGTIATAFLLAFGVSPALVSSQVHSARVFTSGVSGYSHHRFGNINKKLFKSLLIPGIAGAVLGASLAVAGQKYAIYLRLPLALYTTYLGFYILKKAFKKKKNSSSIRYSGWLAAAGGFMDAFAGGGWGTLVTSTLLAKRKEPKYVIGTVCLVEFFVVFSSSVTFFLLLRHIPVAEIAGLIIGGLIAAPIAVRLVGKLPLRLMFILVGLLVMITSFSSLYKVIFQVL